MNKPIKFKSPELDNILKLAQALSVVESSGLQDFYRFQKTPEGGYVKDNKGNYIYNKIPQHGSFLDEKDPKYRATEDTLIAFTYADLLSSGARGDFRPDTSVAARTPRPELIEALKTLKLLNTAPLSNLRSWGIHGDSAGRTAAGTAKAIEMAAIDDMDKRKNPRTLAPLGKPVIEKFIDENGIEQEALVREVLEGGHILGAKEFSEQMHNPANIVAEPYSENRRTAPREWKEMNNGTFQKEVNTDEWQLYKAAQEFQSVEGMHPTRYIAEMSKLAQDEPKLRPRLEYLFKRMGLQLNQSL